MSTQKPPLKSLLNFKPKKVSLGAERVKTSFIQGLRYPIVAEPTMEGVILIDWVKNNKAKIESWLHEYGAVLFRNFGVKSREHFQEIIAGVNDDFMLYKDRSSPRTEVSGNIYTSTDHPADQHINMHNELSYSQNWPLKIAFFCHIQPSEGGETPIADVRKVYQGIRPGAVSRFAETGILYRRNLQQGIGLSWQQVYQTNSRDTVEAHCKSNGLDFEWQEGDGLIIRWKRPAVQVHPETGEHVWFNHGYFFNSQALEPEVRAAFSNEEDLPFNTYYGDGTPIDQEIIEEIKEAYEKATVSFLWQKGDILLLDNMLMAHGRFPFKGDREINVVMAEPHH